MILEHSTSSHNYSQIVINFIYILLCCAWSVLMPIVIIESFLCSVHIFMICRIYNIIEMCKYFVILGYLNWLLGYMLFQVLILFDNLIDANYRICNKEYMLLLLLISSTFLILFVLWKTHRNNAKERRETSISRDPNTIFILAIVAFCM